MRTPPVPVLLQPGVIQDFPDPLLADDWGLVAVGGDLQPERLLRAYRQGVFPWPHEGLPDLWWSPNPRAVLTRDSLHISRSLRRLLRHLPGLGITVTWDQDFVGVMQACAQRPEGTWITPAMVQAYTSLHALGHAHSVEVWGPGRDLVGGLYGVHCGGLFAAESMFHRRDNASKVALVYAVQALFAAGIQLLDVQVQSPHLQSLGAFTIPRAEYLKRLRQLRDKTVDLSHLGGSAA